MPCIGRLAHAIRQRLYDDLKRPRDLFHAWDKDGGGAINFRELQKILSSVPKEPAAPKKGKAALKAAGSKMLAAAAFAK